MNLELISRLQLTIDYIENNIKENIKLDEILKISFMSKTSFYNIFSEVIGVTLKDYIRKRRLSLSATNLLLENNSVLSIALEYGYSSSESYSRAFKSLFGMSPQAYRKNNTYFEIYPRISLNKKLVFRREIMNYTKMNSETVIENLNKFQMGYLLDVDIDGFSHINDTFGRAFGDKVLLEIPNRISAALESLNLDSSVNRISADEFAVIIKNQDSTIVESLSNKILEAMTQEITLNDISHKVSVSIGIGEFAVNSDISSAPEKAREAMIRAKKSGKCNFSY